MLAPVAEDLTRVDALIGARLASDVALVRQVARVHRRRRRQAAAAGAAPARLPARSAIAGEAHLQLAAVVEFIHTATLLHDDVVDESHLRRGRSTANAAFGNAATVLVGDFLYSRAFQMMVELDDMRVMQVLADATNMIAEGEVLQLMGSHDPDGRRGALPRGDPAQDREAVRGGGAPRRRAGALVPGGGGGPRRLRRAPRHRVPADRRRARLLGRRDRRSARTSATTSPKASRRCR